MTISSTVLRPGSDQKSKTWQRLQAWVPILFCVGAGIAIALIAYFEQPIVRLAKCVWPYLDLM